MFYTEDHEWITIEGDIITVGITDYASAQLGDVVFVELPELGRVVETGDEVAVIESVKAASDILAPMAGEVVAVNEAIVESPALVNEAPMQQWFFKLKLAGVLPELLDEAAYNALIG